MHKYNHSKSTIQFLTHRWPRQIYIYIYIHIFSRCYIPFLFLLVFCLSKTHQDVHGSNQIQQSFGVFWEVRSLTASSVDAISGKLNTKSVDQLLTVFVVLVHEVSGLPFRLKIVTEKHIDGLSNNKRSCTVEIIACPNISSEVQRDTNVAVPIATSLWSESNVIAPQVRGNITANGTMLFPCYTDCMCIQPHDLKLCGSCFAIRMWGVKLHSLGERPTQAKNTSPRAFQQMQRQRELQLREKQESKVLHQKNLTCQLTLPAFGAPTLNSWGHLEIAIGPSFLRWGLTHSRYEGRNGFVGLYFMFTFIGLLLI